MTIDQPSDRVNTRFGACNHWYRIWRHIKPVCAVARSILAILNWLRSRA